MKISKDLVDEWVEYKDGSLYWKKSPNWSIKIGAALGTLNKGYLRSIICGTKIYNHQLSFLINKGYIPECIDHIDGDKLNNRIDNLRDVSFKQNAMNKKHRSNNQSGFKGMSKHKNGWQAEISKKYIGLYQTPELAAAAYNERAKIEFGEYAVLNNLNK